MAEYILYAKAIFFIVVFAYVYFKIIRPIMNGEVSAEDAIKGAFSILWWLAKIMFGLFKSLIFG